MGDVYSGSVPREPGFNYNFTNGGDFQMEHLERARRVLGLVSECGILLDADLVEGDIHHPTFDADDPTQHVARGEVRVTRRLSEVEVRALSGLGIMAEASPAGIGIAA